MPEELLTIQQAAEKLGVSTKTIRRWESEGKIESLRTSGGHRRFRLKHINQPTLYTKKQLFIYLTIASCLASVMSFLSTRQFYIHQSSKLSSQLEALINQQTANDIPTNQRSGVAHISSQDNGQIFIKTSQVYQNANIQLAPVDQEIELHVDQIFPGLGFIVSTRNPIQTPAYFNWQISN